MSKRCFSKCRKHKDCPIPLCKYASGEKREFCRLDGKSYRLNSDCKMISKDSGSLVDHKFDEIKNKTLKVSQRSPSSKKVKISPPSKTLKSKSLSYRPTINQDLVTPISIPNSSFSLCNLTDFKLNVEKKYYKKPLTINIKGTCMSVFEEPAQKFLLRQLSANKHLNMKKVIAPKQSSNNCWFNCMFVTFFISDKGRQFFHYFRSLMILGELPNGDKIPQELRNGFSLLNYNIDVCLSGNIHALKLMDTNDIIKYIHKRISHYSEFIYPYGSYGSPLRYYDALVNYMSLKSIKMIDLTREDSVLLSFNVHNKIKKIVSVIIKKYTNITPHVIMLRFDDNNLCSYKMQEFEYDGFKYKLDSCCVRDISQNHFTAGLTCNGEQYGYDGASYTHLIPLEWKNKLNKNENYKFIGSMKYNFLKSYVMLFYYRTK